MALREREVSQLSGKMSIWRAGSHHLLRERAAREEVKQQPAEQGHGDSGGFVRAPRSSHT